jgi:DNA modification methylase
MAEVQETTIDKLIPDQHNANAGTERGRYMLDHSLRQYGAGRSILVDKNGRVIAGNKTLEVAADIGLDDVIVVETDGNKLVAVKRTDLDLEDGERARLLAYADNRAGQVGLEWDAEAIAFDLEAGLDLGDMFREAELVDLGALTVEPPADPGAQMDRAAELQEKWNVQRGQVWEIGRHRLMCGDSTSAEDVARLMGGERAAMVFTDPPYNHASEDQGVAASVSKAHADLMASEWDRDFDFQTVAPRIDLAGQIWAWMSKRSSCDGYCVWTKPNPMPSLMKRHWTWASELICYATRGHHTFNFPASGHAPNVWEIQKRSDGLHPTEKPPELASHAITHSSKRGDLIADLFTGSGTTLVACEQTNRIGYGMEIEPKYCAVTLERLTGMGLEAVLLSENAQRVNG